MSQRLSNFFTTRHGYVPIPSEPESSDENVLPTDTVDEPLLPKITRRSPSANPLPLPTNASHTGSAAMSASWIEVVPQDLRIRALTKIPRKSVMEFVLDDLASYARTSKAAYQDVIGLHHQWREPRASLLASRHLISSAWEAAEAKGWFGREEAFKCAIKSAAEAYSAIILDGREGAQFSAHVPAAVSALLDSNIEHLHLRLGYSNYNDGLFNAAPVSAIEALIQGCKKRLEQGKSMPTVFLHVQGMPARLLADALRESPVSLNITGLSLCSHPENLKIQLQGPKAAAEINQLVSRECARKTDWDGLFSSIKGVRHLHFSGWEGLLFGQALVEFLSSSSSLEELHMPMCLVSHAQFDAMTEEIQKKKSFKALGIDVLAFYIDTVYRGQSRLLKALKNNPDMVLISRRYESKPEVLHGALAKFWREGRYISTPYPNAMRALPEIYGKADLFGPMG